MELSEFAAKCVTVAVSCAVDSVRYTIKDEGLGFDWEKYLEVDPARLLDSHGRGIAMAAHASFDSIEYRGGGSEVSVRVLVDTNRGPAASEARRDAQECHA